MISTYIPAEASLRLTASCRRVPMKNAHLAEMFRIEFTSLANVGTESRWSELGAFQTLCRRRSTVAKIRCVASHKSVVPTNQPVD